MVDDLSDILSGDLSGTHYKDDLRVARGKSNEIILLN